MYGWLWRTVPGGVAAKLAVMLVLLTAVLAVLFFVAFPYVEAHLPFADVTVGNPDHG